QAIARAATPGCDAAGRIVTGDTILGLLGQRDPPHAGRYLGLYSYPYRWYSGGVRPRPRRRRAGPGSGAGPSGTGAGSTAPRASRSRNRARPAAGSSGRGGARAGRLERRRRGRAGRWWWSSSAPLERGPPVKTPTPAGQSRTADEESRGARPRTPTSLWPGRRQAVQSALSQPARSL